MSGDAFQVLRDCPDCLVEAAMVEFIDPEVAQGVAVEAWCRLCGRRESLGDLTYRGLRFHGDAGPKAQEHARRALVRWAVAEGALDVDEFCLSNFGGVSAHEVVGRLLARETVHTTFDVVAFLFPGMGGGMGSAAPPPPLRPEQKLGDGQVFSGPPSEHGGAVPRLPAQDLRILEAETLMDGLHDELQRAETWMPEHTDEVPIHQEKARVAARALAAVMLADGRIRDGERRFLDLFLQKAGLPPATSADVRAWRPAELPLPADPAPLLHAMIELAFVDRERDGTEWRVIREFARYWGYPLDELEDRGRRAEQATAPAMRRLWSALRGMFITERA